MGKEASFNAMDHVGSEKREAERVEKQLTARVKNSECAVLNISQKGVLLQSKMPLYFFSISETINFDLEIGGDWVTLTGIVKWVITHHDHSRIGLFIKQAPIQYVDYLKGIYG